MDDRVREPHSAGDFGVARSFWWNADFLQLMRQRWGLESVGEGNSSVGDLVPGWVSELGFRQIQVYQSDKATPFFSPYDTPEQVVLARAYFEGDVPDRWLWSRPDTLRYFLAGGGTQAEFDRMWLRFRDEYTSQREAFHQRQFHQAGGKLMYLISGRKPELRV